MPVPAQRHPDETRARLRGWMADRIDAGIDVELTEGPAASGYSHETIPFDASWDDGTGRVSSRFVTRVEPRDHSVFPAPDLGAEYRVMDALARTDVPVPAIVGYEPDPALLGAPFLVMEHVPGSVPEDNPPYTMGGWLADADPDEQARVWWTGLEAMAAVHRIDPAAADLDWIAGGRPPGPATELDRLRSYVAWAADGDVPSGLEAGVRWLGENLPAEPRPAVLCWGDSRIGNQIFDDYRCVAVLDWEMVTIGDPVQDLAWFLYFDRLFSVELGVERLAGFASPAETTARWSELTGFDPVHLAYYDVWAGVRFSAILMRLARLMVMFDRLPSDTTFGTDNFASQYLTRQLAAAGVTVAG